MLHARSVPLCLDAHDFFLFLYAALATDVLLYACLCFSNAICMGFFFGLAVRPPLDDIRIDYTIVLLLLLMLYAWFLLIEQSGRG